MTYYKKIFGQSLAINRVALNENEREIVNLLDRPSKQSVNDEILILSSFNDIVEQVMKSVSKNHLESFDQILRDEKKSFVTIQGMNSIAFPPTYSFIKPLPSWLTIFYHHNQVYARISPYTRLNITNDLEKTDILDDFPLSDLDPSNWRLGDKLGQLKDIESFYLALGFEAIFSASVHCYNKENHQLYIDTLHFKPYVSTYGVGGMNHPQAFWAAIPEKSKNHTSESYFQSFIDTYLEFWVLQYIEDFAETFMAFMKCKGKIDHYRSRPGVYRKLKSIKKALRYIQDVHLVRP
jgi:hypothetical protein